MAQGCRCEPRKPRGRRHGPRGRGACGGLPSADGLLRAQRGLGCPPLLCSLRFQLESVWPCLRVLLSPELPRLSVGRRPESPAGRRGGSSARRERSPRGGSPGAPGWRAETPDSGLHVGHSESFLRGFLTHGCASERAGGGLERMLFVTDALEPRPRPALEPRIEKCPVGLRTSSKYLHFCERHLPTG